MSRSTTSTIYTTTAQFEETRAAFEAGETAEGIESGVPYRLMDVPEGDEQPAWAWSPDGLGAYWYGSKAELEAQHG